MKWIDLSVALGVAVIATSCAHDAVRTDESRALAERYLFVTEHDAEEDARRQLLAAAPFTRIELSRVDYWTGRETITFERDGGAERMGKELETGWISAEDFGGLCFLIESGAIESLGGRYESGPSDGAVYTLRVWRADRADLLVIENIDYTCPLEIWTLRVAIEGAASRILWKRSG